MTYLLTEIVVYLVIAGLIGFILGWFVKGATQTKELNKREEKEMLMAERTVNETLLASEEIKNNIAITKPEGKTITNEKEPLLLAEAKEEGADKLSSLKGIGDVLESKLNELGIYQFEQIASWTRQEEDWVSMKIGFPKKVTREEWVKQAKALMKASK
jgi:predicted flap endonuclease-1-like 5' DNA nuclease